MFPARKRRRLGALISPLLAIGVVAGAVVSPPADGALLLLPVGPSGLSIGKVHDLGALIIGSGPVTGSLIVRGERAQLLGPMLAAGVLVLAAPTGGCTAVEGRA